MATKASNVAILNAMRSEYELENRLPKVTQRICLRFSQL